MPQDLKYALRSLSKAPGLTAVLVATLALAIGANTAIFSVVDALLFRPLPYPHPERLYALTFANDQPLGSQYWSYPKYAAFAADQTAFSSTAAYSRRVLTTEIQGQPRRTDVEAVTSSYFSLLGATPALGRPFAPSENTVPARDAVAILSDGLWKSAFGADPHAIGRAIQIGDRQYGIVGAMPPGFTGQSGTTEMWVPVMMAAQFEGGDVITGEVTWWLRVVGRLKDGLSPAQASAELPAIMQRVQRAAPASIRSMTRNGVMSLQLLPLRMIKVDPAVSTSFTVLLGIVGLVLLIACTNTANLLLGRSVAHHREFAVRRALGASKWEIVRQTITETLLIGLAAGVGATVAAVWGLDWLSDAKPMNASGFWSQYARTFDYFRATLDARVLAFNFGAALAIGILAGLVPALYASDVDLNDALKQHTSGSSRGFRAVSGRGALVLAELALSVVMLICAGLLIRSFVRAATVDLGFQPRGVVAMTASLERKPATVYRDLLGRVSAIPGVERAALMSAVPQGFGMSSLAVQIEGRVRTDLVRVNVNVVTPEAFATLGIRTMAGRIFTADDREDTSRVAVINAAFARTAWPGQSPIGRHIRSPLRVAYGNSGDWTTVIGVVDDVLYGAVDEPRQPVLYLSAWQPLGTPTAVSIGADVIVLRTKLAADTAAAAVRAALRAVDPAAPLNDIASMQERVDRATSKYRFSGVMVGVLAILALAVAAIGTYAVIAFAVASRTREIGIRIALGATRRDVVRLVMSTGVRLTLAGTALGVAGAYAGSRVLSSVLLDVTPHDPATFAVAPTVLVLVALAASYVPARGALTLDPVIALKTE